MVGRDGVDEAASLRALRGDLMDALRTCGAVTPAAPWQQRRSDVARKVADYLSDPEIRMMRANIPALPARIDGPIASPRRRVPEQSAPIRAQYQARSAFEIEDTIGLVGRCFAVPEITALLRLSIRVVTQAGHRLLGETPPSRRRISVSRLRHAKA